MRRRGDPRGVDWESAAALEDTGHDVDHEWDAHDAGFIDPDLDDLESELLAEEG